MVSGPDKKEKEQAKVDDVVAEPKGSLPYKVVRLERCLPNPWNPNEMAPEHYAKLKSGLQRTLRKNSKRIMPIVVRRHPSESGKYEIIDGFHRWKAFGELKQERIGIFVIKADDQDARVLTSTLNYLRGKPNRKKYAQSLVELLEHGAKIADLEELLPDSAEDIETLLDEAKVSIKAFEQLTAEMDELELEDGGDTDASPTGEDAIWVELGFKVSLSQAKVIEAELTRIGTKLRGKNRRGRALEYMAVQSSQADIGEAL